MNCNTLNFQSLDPIAYPLVNQFYNLHRVRGRVNKSERVWVAKHKLDIKAACRIQPNLSVALLVGVFVVEPFRKQGVASQLITLACQSCPLPLYTFPYRHLSAFYQDKGFKLVPPDVLPEILAKKYQAYCAQGRDIIAMQYCSSKITDIAG